MQADLVEIKNEFGKSSYSSYQELTLDEHIGSIFFFSSYN